MGKGDQSTKISERLSKKLNKQVSFLFVIKKYVQEEKDKIYKGNGRRKDEKDRGGRLHDMMEEKLLIGASYESTRANGRWSR